MEIDDKTRQNIRTLCGYLADHGMVNSPDGPYAQRIRALGQQTDFSDDDLDQLRRRALGEAMGGAHVVRAAMDQTRTRAMLLAGLMMEGQPREILHLVDKALPEQEPPQMLAVYAAHAILGVLGRPGQEQPQ